MVKRRFTRKRTFKARPRNGISYRTRTYRMAGQQPLVTRGVRMTGTHLFKRVCNVSNPVHTNVVFDKSQGVWGINADDSWVYNNNSGLGGLNTSYLSFGVNFTLDMLPNYGEFTVLFDQYKVNGVKFKLTPYSNMAPTQVDTSIANSNQAVSGWVHSIVDYDDSAAPNPSKAGIDSIRQFQSYKCKQLFRPGAGVSRYIKPHLAVGAYGGGAFTSYMNMPPKWIDANSSNVEHYGIKGIIQLFEPNINTGAYFWFKVECKVYLSFKNPR